jgi:hypothetical protein
MMTLNQLRSYLSTMPVNVDPVEEDLYLVTNIVSFQEAYLIAENRYEDSSLIHLFYEVGIPAPPHLRDESHKYRVFRLGLFNKYQVPAMPDTEEN